MEKMTLSAKAIRTLKKWARQADAMEDTANKAADKKTA